MKKLLLPVLFLFVSLGCFAQEQEPEDRQGPTAIQRNHNLLSGSDAPNAGFGIKGGVNFANVYGVKDLIDTDTHINFHAGIYAQISISEKFSMQAEGLYSRKGFETDIENRFDYLELPLLAVVNVSERFSLHAGPQLSIMVAAKQDGKEINMDDLNTFDYGVVGGAEARFGFVRIGARYNLGFAGLTDEGDTGLAIGEDMKNSVAQLYLGLGF